MGIIIHSVGSCQKHAYHEHLHGCMVYDRGRPVSHRVQPLAFRLSILGSGVLYSSPLRVHKLYVREVSIACGEHQDKVMTRDNLFLDTSGTSTLRLGHTKRWSASLPTGPSTKNGVERTSNSQRRQHNHPRRRHSRNNRGRKNDNCRGHNDGHIKIPPGDQHYKDN